MTADDEATTNDVALNVTFMVCRCVGLRPLFIAASKNLCCSRRTYAAERELVRSSSTLPSTRRRGWDLVSLRIEATEPAAGCGASLPLPARQCSGAPIWDGRPSANFGRPPSQHGGDVDEPWPARTGTACGGLSQMGFVPSRPLHDRRPAPSRNRPAGELKGQQSDRRSYVADSLTDSRPLRPCGLTRPRSTTAVHCSCPGGGEERSGRRSSDGPSLGRLENGHGDHHRH